MLHNMTESGGGAAYAMPVLRNVTVECLTLLWSLLYKT